MHSPIPVAVYGIVNQFCKAVGTRDAYTACHGETVADLMAGLAVHMSFSEWDWQIAYLAGITHDIGKVGIPDNILKKSTALTKDEYEIIRTHPVIGAKMLAEFEGFDEIIPAVRHHHERVDGKGYPSNLRGDNIPKLSRMLAVCDAFDAMTSPRIYREPVAVCVALQEIARCAGTQFDTEIASQFIEFIKRTNYLQQAM